MADTAYACSTCAYRAGDQLHEIADMAPAARDVAHGFARRGGGAASGKPGSSLPFDLTATSKLDAVQNELGTWVRHIVEQRGVYPAHLPPGFDVIPHSALFLAGHVEWIRHRQEADEFLDAVDACLRVVRGLARGPAEQKYLGPCGAPMQIDVTGIGMPPRSEFLDGPPCDGDVYASRGSRVGRCRACGAEVSTAERAAWLDGEVRSHAFRDIEIARAYKLSVKTIRSWATDRPEVRNAAGKLVRSATSARLLPHAQDTDGQPLYLVGDVLDLAAADVARRESNRSRRSRMAADQRVA